MSQSTTEVHLVYVNTLNNNNKFWRAVALDNGNLEVTWGRVGYNGQSQVHKCNSFESAACKLQILAAKKRQKGYIDSAIDSKSNQKQQIYRALELLSLLKRGCDRSHCIEMLDEYLSLVPTPYGMQIHPSIVLSSITEIERHEQLLQNLLVEPEIQMQPAVEGKKVTSLKSLSHLFWQTS